MFQFAVFAVRVILSHNPVQCDCLKNCFYIRDAITHLDKQLSVGDSIKSFLVFDMEEVIDLLNSERDFKS